MNVVGGETSPWVALAAAFLMGAPAAALVAWWRARTERPRRPDAVITRSERSLAMLEQVNRRLSAENDRLRRVMQQDSAQIDALERQVQTLNAEVDRLRSKPDVGGGLV